jgi:hypothetical protein
MWEILILKQFLPLKMQINSKKPGFGRKKVVENVVTLEGKPIQFKHDFLSYLAIQKIPYIHGFAYFVMGSHLSQ